MEDTFERDVIASSKSLRAFAISLSGNGDRADDLVQETLLRAIANKSSFQPGSNLPAWLFTILRNLFRSDYRKRRREVEDADGSYAKTLKTQPDQIAHIEYENLRAALEKLPVDQRDAVILVGASGFSYEEAALICNCAVGTVKSRLNRARVKLHDLLETFELRELNKKSWQEPDDPVQATFMDKRPVWGGKGKIPDKSLPVDSPLEKKRRKGIWNETERTSGTLPLFHPPLEASPVKRFTKKEIAAFSIPIPKAARVPESRPVKVELPAQLKATAKFSIIVDGTAYELVGTSMLPNGKTQQLFRAA